MPMTLNLVEEDRARILRLLESTRARSMSQVVSDALAVYEQMTRSDEIAVTVNGKTITLLLP